MRALWTVGLLVLTVTPSGLGAQAPLTLAEAFARADRQAYANRVAAAGRVAQEGTGRAALRGILPTVRVEAGWMRTTDPLGAFGFTLRQRAVTPAAFDPARLNNPDAASNLGAGLVLEQPLVNLDAWLGRAAARQADQSARARQRWTATTTRVEVVRAWFGGVLAREKVATLEAGVRAAEGHVRQATALVDQGMVTRADLLLAQVRAGELAADLVAARGDLGLAARRLGMVLGTPDDTSLVLPASLPAEAAITAALAALGPVPGDPRHRDDVLAARFGREAAGQDLRRTRAGLLPRLNGFARYDWNDPNALFGGDQSWTVGLMASWTPFSGGAELAAVQTARGRAAEAEAGLEAVEAGARLDQAERENALSVAQARLAIAAQSILQGEEAHRLVSRSYAGGLASVADLLSAAAAETAARMAHSAARYEVLVAAAERQRAAGLSLDFLTALGR